MADERHDEAGSRAEASIPTPPVDDAGAALDELLRIEIDEELEELDAEAAPDARSVAGSAPVAGPSPAALDPDRVAADLSAVEAALERLDRGAYGRCEVCHIVLDEAVLAADPTVAACPAHIHLRNAAHSA